MTFTAAQLQQVLDDHMQEGLYPILFGYGMKFLNRYGMWASGDLDRGGGGSMISGVQSIGTRVVARRSNGAYLEWRRL